jgi:hypothetical protein
MSTAALFFALAAIEVAGLFVIWFRLKSKVGSYLELENLLAGVREEARALVLELNETADRNVSLVEDRMSSLRELLAEVDRRIGVEKRELETRSVEREVYAKLARRRPIVPAPEANASPEPAPQARRAPEPWMRESEPTASPRREDEPIPLDLGATAEARGSTRTVPEVALSEDILLASRTKREEALDLYRRGISADLIAARLGATVAEIELLVELEESRARTGGGSAGGGGGL